MAEGGGIKEILQKETAGLPNWAWVAIIVAGIVAVYVVPKLTGGSKPTDPNATDPNATDPNAATGVGGSGVPQLGYGAQIDPNTGLPYGTAIPGPAGPAGPAGAVGPAGAAGIAGAVGAIGPVGPAGAPGMVGAAGAPGGQGPAGTPGTTTPAPTPKPVPVPVPKPVTTIPGPVATHYTVVAGDTISGIALKLGITQAALLAANHQITNPNLIQPGQVLTVPGKTTTPAPTTTAQRFVTVTAWPTPTSTLSGIASANGLTLQRLEQLNPNITNPTTIQPGQKVRVA